MHLLSGGGGDYEVEMRRLFSHSLEATTMISTATNVMLMLMFTRLMFDSEAYKPVAIVHGIMFNPKDHMEFLRDEIIKAQPDTRVNLLEILHDQQSFLPMWYQVSQFGAEIKKMVDEYPGGINLIGYSQGGLIARGVIETIPDHNIDTFISLSSPQLGHHGEIFVPQSTFKVGNEEKFSVSVAGLWKDPKDLEKYKREGRYLATLTNEIKHDLNDQFKDTMCKLKRLVLIGGPDDGVVVPWQSSQFAFDDENGQLTEMKDQPIYQNDSICLKTLDEKGAITIHTVPGVHHFHWFDNVTVIQNYILPYLA